MLGYMYRTRPQRGDYPFPQFSFDYTHTIRRLNSNTRSFRDLIQDGNDTERANPSITDFVEYVNMFEYRSAFHIVARDYGKPVRD